MTLKEKIDIKFKRFFAAKDRSQAIKLKEEILGLLDEDKFPVYKPANNHEPSYQTIFTRYFEANMANRQALEWVHYAIMIKLSNSPSNL